MARVNERNVERLGVGHAAFTAATERANHGHRAYAATGAKRRVVMRFLRNWNFNRDGSTIRRVYKLG